MALLEYSSETAGTYSPLPQSILRNTIGDTEETMTFVCMQKDRICPIRVVHAKH
jgi:hypothetical protein